MVESYRGSVTSLCQCLIAACILLLGFFSAHSSATVYDNYAIYKGDVDGDITAKGLMAAVASTDYHILPDGKYTRSFNQTTPPLVSNYRFPIEFQGNDVYLGVGASYSFSDAFAINLDYEYHSWDEKRMELKNNNLSLSVYYYFK